VAYAASSWDLYRAGPQLEAVHFRVTTRRGEQRPESPPYDTRIILFDVTNGAGFVNLLFGEPYVCGLNRLRIPKIQELSRN
jgi:hypothetical protein